MKPKFLFLFAFLAFLQFDPPPISASPPYTDPPDNTAGVQADSTDWVKVLVLAVHDLDSWKVKFPDGHAEWVRLVGIDAPEVFSPYVLKTQPWGREAGDIARGEYKGKYVYIDTLPAMPAYDMYKRRLVEVYAGDQVVALSFVERGLAWPFYVKNRKIPNMNDILKRAKTSARINKQGLFAAQTRPLTPETWRRRYAAR